VTPRWVWERPNLAGPTPVWAAGTNGGGGGLGIAAIAPQGGPAPWSAPATNGGGGGLGIATTGFNLNVHGRLAIGFWLAGGNGSRNQVSDPSSDLVCDTVPLAGRVVGGEGGGGWGMGGNFREPWCILHSIDRGSQILCLCFDSPTAHGTNVGSMHWFTNAQWHAL
jgi:hypothetical protein